ncbi:hypothetical protein SESBI_21368 [Sesbania bispinosa]|nr:hypothetical protein SESBI_21368 [Sesbania bispinosa]
MDWEAGRTDEQQGIIPWAVGQVAVARILQRLEGHHSGAQVITPPGRKESRDPQGGLQCKLARPSPSSQRTKRTIQKQIERLIKDGYLRRFVSTGGKRPSGGEGTRRDTVGRQERILGIGRMSRQRRTSGEP